MRSIGPVPTARPTIRTGPAMRPSAPIGKPLTASWSKGRRDYYAYYHCRGRCRTVNISKAKLEELFVEELARLQPTAGFMRLVKDRVLHAWREIKTDAARRIAEVGRSS